MSCVGLGAGLLCTRDQMQFSKDEASDNSALQPIAFARKSLTSTKHITPTMKEKLQAYCMA